MEKQNFETWMLSKGNLKKSVIENMIDYDIYYEAVERRYEKEQKNNKNDRKNS